MKKRVLSLFLSIAMLITVFSGCSAKQTAETKAESSAVADDNVNLKNSDLPIIKDPSKVSKMKVAISAYPERLTKAGDLPQIKRMAKETGVEFDWIEIPSNGIIEKVNLMLSSRDLPDAFWDSITNEMVVQYMGQDILIPTEELTKKYMPNLTKIFEQRPQYKAAATAPDGHRYGFPYIEEMYGLVLTPGPFLINQEWLKKVNKEMPKTVDEWADVLRAFKKAGDLNGNGKVDEIPYAFGFGAIDTFGSFDTFNHFTAAFGQMNTAGGNRPEDYLAIKDGKVIFTPANAAYKDTAKFFNGLHKEGLIDIDSFSPHPTPTLALYTDKIKGSNAVIGSFGVWAPVNMLPDLKVREQYVPLPRLEGPKGKTGQALNFSEMQNVARFAITTACKTPEILARYVDYMYSPEISVTANWGSLDYAFKKGSDGVLRYDLDEKGQIKLKNNFKTFQEMAANTRGSKAALAVLNDYYDKVCEYAWDAKDLLAFQKVNGKEAILKEAGSVPRMLRTTEEQSTISQIQPQIRNIVDSYRMQWILNGNADATWDKYLADLKAAGLDKMLAAFQSSYDRYLKSLK